MFHRSAYCVLLFVLFSIACFPKAEIKEPDLTKGYRAVSDDLLQLLDFEELTITNKTNASSGLEQSHEIVVTLTNAYLLPETEAGLDSLAKKAGAVVKKCVRNINEYDWLSIVFQQRGDEAFPAVNLKNVYTYRPDAIN